MGSGQTITSSYFSTPQIRFMPLVSTEPEESHSTGTRSRHVDIDVDDNDNNNGDSDGGKTDGADDDYILVDDPESEMAEKESEEQARWTPFWKKVRTAMVIEAPKDVEIR